MRFLSYLKSKSRIILSVIGLIALSLVIWFVLPAVRVGGGDPFGSAWVRGGMIVSMFAMTLLYRMKGMLTNRSRSKQLGEQVSAQPSGQCETLGKQEVGELRKKFDEALALLKKVKVKNGSRGSYLYVLPWYVLIGPPGSGKTTALLNSSLHFPLVDSVGAAVKGVGGTRNCDWWFTDEAVLLDTAGRYTNQKNQSELDSIEWKGFLSLLKKFRKRKPINGVVVAFGVDDLIKMPESEVISNAKLIKQRIQEFQETFGMRFPVYIMLTKLDMLPGFIDYFDDLGRDEAKQVWGMTFPLEEEQDVVPQFIVEFRALQERIQGRELDRLQVETDSKRREAIYLFPRTLGLLQDSVSIFLSEIFKQTRYETQPMLRGLYFTSGTQDGSTLDRVVTALASKFGLKAGGLKGKIGKGKGYFLEHLFTKVIFAESGLAGANIKVERKLFYLHSLGYSLVTALFLATAVLMGISYAKNSTLIDEVNSAIAQSDTAISNIDQTDKEPYIPSDALQAVRQIPAGYEWGGEAISTWHTFGLYQGDKLGTEAKKAYARLLYKTFLPRVLMQLEVRMRERESTPDYLYETLRVYLMLGEPDKIAKEVVRAWVVQDWERSLPKRIDQAALNSMDAHLVALIELLPEQSKVQLDLDLISSVRSILTSLSTSRRLYYRLKSEALHNVNLEPFQVVNAAGREAPLIFRFGSGLPITHRINGFFTSEGYRHYFSDLKVSLGNMYGDEQWVMGTTDGVAIKDYDYMQTEMQVRRLYMDDYLLEWKAYLADLDFVPMNSTSQTLLVLNSLSSDESPLVKLLLGVQKHTSEQAFAINGEVISSPEVQSASDKIHTPNDSSPVKKLKDRLSKLQGNTANLVARNRGNRVTRYFESQNQMLVADKSGKAPIDATIQAISQLYVYLNAIDEASNKGRQAWSDTKDPLGSNGSLSKIGVEVERQPKFVSRLLDRISKRASIQTVTDARSYMKRNWKTNVSSSCRDMIERRYPFNKTGAREVTLDDLSAYFGPNGIVERYFDEYLVDYVDRSRHPWKWNRSNGVDTGFSDVALKQVETAKIVRDTFFRTGSASPEISFELRPHQMDKRILRMGLVINDNQMNYSHGPRSGKKFNWPGGHDSRRGIARLVLTTSEGQVSITEHGDWALFKLFDRAKISKIDSEHFKLEFSLKQGLGVSLELRAGSVYNPFDLPELGAIRCN